MAGKYFRRRIDDLGDLQRGAWKVKEVLAFLKRWLPGVVATLLAMSLIYVAKDYPCLRGAGLALADFEAFILFMLIALPCLAWAVRRLLFRPVSNERPTWEERWIAKLAVITVVGVALYAVLAIPVIFSFAQHPLQFMCG